VPVGDDAEELANVLIAFAEELAGVWVQVQRPPLSRPIDAGASGLDRRVREDGASGSPPAEAFERSAVASSLDAPSGGSERVSRSAQARICRWYVRSTPVTDMMNTIAPADTPAQRCSQKKIFRVFTD
jgi:hypothetical protein